MSLLSTADDLFGDFFDVHHTSLTNGKTKNRHTLHDVFIPEALSDLTCVRVTTQSDI